MLADIVDLQKIRRAVLHLLLMLALVTVQTQLLSRLTVFGTRAMFIPAVVVCIGMREGGVYGGLMGLVAGLFCDGAFDENLVTFTLSFPIFGMLAGVLTERLVNRRFFSYLFMALAALLLTGFIQMFGLLVFYGASPLDLLATAIKQALLSLPFAAAVYPIYRALSRYGTPRR